MTTGRGNGSLTTSRAVSVCADAASSRRKLSADRRGPRPKDRLDRQHHRVATHEPRDVVNVPVRVVTDTAFAEPDCAPNPEPFREDAFVILPSKTWIANWTSLSSHSSVTRSSPAVDLDTAAFEDDALSSVGADRLVASEAGEARHEAAHFDVALPVRILRPTVERPVQQHDVACGVDHTCGAESRSHTRSVGTR